MTEAVISSTRTCKGCGGEIPPTRPDPRTLFCSITCKQRYWRRTHPEQSNAWGRRKYWKNVEKSRARGARNFRNMAPDVYQRRLARWRERYRIQQYGAPLTNEEMVRDPYRVARAQGFRSGLEVRVAKELDAVGAIWHYEPFRIPYKPTKMKHYVPDIVLENGVCCELKGRWETNDRQKHLLIKQQHPAIDIRLVFDAAHKTISKESNTTYAMWCDYKGIKWAEKSIPTSWLEEPANTASLQAIRNLCPSFPKSH